VLSLVPAIFAGVPLGVISGFYGGAIDNVIMRLMDIMLAFPIFLLAIVVMVILEPSTTNVVIALGIVRIPIYARIVRGSVEMACVFAGKIETVLADAVLLVTARNPRDELYRDLQARRGDWPAAGIKSVRAIGDAHAPGTIAAAVYAGHRYAQELDAPDNGDGLPFKREIAAMLPI